MDKQPSYHSYNWETINQYVQGKMTAEEMYWLEKQALQDPFLADALEGLVTTNIAASNANIAALNKQILHQASQGKKVALPKKSNSKNWLYIASVAAIFTIVVVSIYRFNTKENANRLVSTVQPSTAKEEINQDTLLPTANQPVVVADKKITRHSPSTSTHTSNTTTTLMSTENSVNDMVSSNRDDKVTSLETNRQNKQPLNTNKDAVSNDMASLKQAAARDSLPVNFSAEMAKKKEVESLQNVARSYTGLMNNNNLIQGKAITPQGTPIANAYVQVPTTNYKTLTDNAGNFSVPTQNIQDSNVIVNISSLGFNTTQTTANNNRSNVVVLTPADNALNEVVVTNLGNKNRLAKTSMPFKDIGMDTVLSPVGGWPAFEHYLNNLGYKNSLFDSTFGNSVNTRMEALPQQDVVIEFNADRRGNPTNIQVLQAPSQEEADKAVEAIKKGPKWSSRSKKAKAKVAIKL